MRRILGIDCDHYFQVSCFGGKTEVDAFGHFREEFLVDHFRNGVRYVLQEQVGVEFRVMIALPRVASAPRLEISYRGGDDRSRKEAIDMLTKMLAAGFGRKLILRSELGAEVVVFEPGAYGEMCKPYLATIKDAKEVATQFPEVFVWDDKGGWTRVFQNRVPNRPVQRIIPA